MATYTYKALTKRGLIVRNRVEAPTKQSLIKSLKQNQLLPISVTKIPYGGKKVKRKQKRNISNVEDMIKNINTTRIEPREKQSSYQKVRSYFTKQQKITSRDIVVFTFFIMSSMFDTFLFCFLFTLAPP